VLRATTFLNALETAGIGRHILPVVESIKDSIPFLLFIAFALMCSTSLFWGLSNRSSFSVFRSVFRLGLLADFDVDEDVFGDIAESFGWEYISFVLTAFLISLSLMNIFIGHMTSLYDNFQSRAAEMFVRRRAHTSMRYMLQAEGCRNMWRSTLEMVRTVRWRCCKVRRLRRRPGKTETRQLWLCFKNTKGSGSHDDNGDLSLRHFLKSEMKSEIERLEQVLCEASVERVSASSEMHLRRIERLEQNIEALRKEFKVATGDLRTDINAIKCIVENAQRVSGHGRLEFPLPVLN